MSKFQVFVLLWIGAPGLIGCMGYLWKGKFLLAAAMGLLLFVVVALAMS